MAHTYTVAHGNADARTDADTYFYTCIHIHAYTDASGDSVPRW